MGAIQLSGFRVKGWFRDSAETVEVSVEAHAKRLLAGSYRPSVLKEVRKLEHHYPPAPKVKYGESTHKSSLIHVPTF